VAPSPRSAEPVFVGIRTLRYKYVEYWTGVREIYDLASDPYELSNFGGTAPPDVVTPLSSLLRNLSTCVGAACRAAETFAAP
jgi:hypothetical protein